MTRHDAAGPERRFANLPRPTWPDDLPVVARRAEIARAIEANQVVIVCGETGSGKPLRYLSAATTRRLF